MGALDHTSIRLDQIASTGKTVPEVEKISARLFNAVQIVTKYGYSVIRQMMITARYNNTRNTVFLTDFAFRISVISFP